jgi:hypothetical protein
MEDIVSYAIPFGSVGRILNMMIIKRRVKAIFDFRRAKLLELFRKGTT